MSGSTITLIGAVLGVAILATSCSPRDFTWKDTTGKNRSICIAMADQNDCEHRAGLSDKLDDIQQQDADQRATACMVRRGWELADNYESEQEELAEVARCRGTQKKPVGIVN